MPRQAALWALALLTIAAGSYAFEPHPRVEIVFEVEEASQLDRNLRAANAKASVSDAVEAKLLELCETYFGFLGWVRPGQPVDEQEPVARLTVTLGDLNTSMGTENQLRFTGTVEGEGIDMSEVLPLKIYSEFELDKHDAGKIRDRIFAELDEEIATLKTTLLSTFMSNVPLSRQVVGDARKERIYVPLDWTKLRAKSGTILHVEFDVPSDNQAAQVGILTIGSVKERTADPPGSLEGVVLFYDLAPTFIPMPGGWDPVIPGQLGAAANTRVLMQKYLKDTDPGTSNGLALTPD